VPTLTIDLPALAAQRVADAVGAALNLRDEAGAERAATIAEVKEYLITFLRHEVRRQETAKAIKAAQAGVQEVEAT
jgi:hypothetical protein